MKGPVFHGGQLDAAIKQYGGDRDSWLDLSTGINPNGYPVGKIDPSIWQRLPDQAAETRLRNAAKEFYQVPDEFGIVAANGTQTLIELVPKILKSQFINILAPTYGEHAHAWTKGGSHVELIDNLQDVSLLSNALVIVNPNNPDAKIYSRELLRELAEEVGKRHGYLIIDEAFCDFDNADSFVPSMKDNVLIYRSFGKFFGLAGLRLGFLIANKTFINQMENLLGPWCVSGPALEIGAKALNDAEWISQTRVQLKQQSERLQVMLDKAGFKIIGMNPLFGFVDHPNAQAIYQHLLEAQILVRKFPDMPTRLRFGLCRNEQENSRLEQALSHAMSDV